MDTPTQALLGAVVGQAFFGEKLGRRAVVWGALGGAFPDVRGRWKPGTGCRRKARPSLHSGDSSKGAKVAPMAAPAGPLRCLRETLFQLRPSRQIFGVAG